MIQSYKYFLAAFLAVVPCSRFAQCPQNTVLESTINTWDWRSTYYDVWTLDVNQQAQNIQQLSPFHSVNNSGNDNIDFLRSELMKDYEPEDGWELLYRNFGTATNPVAVPSFVLYNRYESKVRVFFLIIQLNNSFSSAEVKMAFNSSTDNESAIFQLMQTPSQSVGDFKKGMYAQTPNAFYNTKHWLSADFPVTYDPCTCEFESVLDFRPFLTDVETIELELDGGGTITQQVVNQSNTSNNGFKSVIDGATSGFSDGKKAGAQAFKGLQAFESFYNAVIVPQTEVVPKPKYKLPGFLKSIPTIGGILGALDFFIGGGRSSANQRPMSFAADFNFDGSGTITETAPYGFSKLATPGSDITNTAQSDIPVYNNVLGLLNVIEKPKVMYRYIGQSEDPIGTYGGEDIYELYYAFQLEEEIKFVVNESAGVELKDIRGAIFNRNRKQLTPFVPLGCLDEVVFRSDCHDDNEQKCELSDGAYVQLSAYFERTDGNPSAEDILFVSSYLVDTEQSNSFVFSENDFGEIPENLEITYAEFIQGGVFIAWNKVIITNVPTNPMPLNPVQIFSDELNYETSAGGIVIPTTLPPNVSLDGFLSICGVAEPVPVQEVQAFCSDVERYNPAVSALELPEEGEEEPEILGLYPNPTEGIATLSFLSKKDQDMKIRILNAVGNIIIRSNRELAANTQYNLDIELSNYDSGIYILNVEINDKTHTMKIVKQ